MVGETVSHYRIVAELGAGARLRCPPKPCAQAEDLPHEKIQSRPIPTMNWSKSTCSSFDGAQVGSLPPKNVLK
jgi:hypothetical protein